MLSDNTSDIFRVATAYEGAKESWSIEPDAASATRELGRARFWDAFAGRYGLPGAALSDAEAQAEAATASGETAVGALAISQRYDLSNMSIDDVLGLADELRAAQRLTQESADLLGYRFDALSFGGDSVFSNSPVAEFARSLQGSSGTSRTLDLIAQQEEQVQYLVDNDADPRAIYNANSVLGQLRLYEREQQLYAQIEASRRDRDEDALSGLGGGGLGGGGIGPFSAPTDLISLPPGAISLFATS